MRKSTSKEMIGGLALTSSLSQTTKKPSKLLPLSHSYRQARFSQCNHNHTHTIKNQRLNHRLNGLKIVRGEKLLRDLSTWGIGGPCNYYIEVFNQNQLVSALRFCHENSLRFMIIGRGSNCLFDDLGFDGCVILNRIEFLERIESGVFRVGSGFGFNRLGTMCSIKGLTGLEFAGGIPGTVGGAAYMNAGANGQETADIVDSVEIVTTGGQFQTLLRVDLSFGYRSSPFQDMQDLAAIAAVTFRLRHSESARRKQLEYLERRRSSQPVGEKSAGSVFRNPSNLGVSAGELIDRAGLKGVRVGGAMVSNIHANFFVNSGESTSRDMLQLISLVKEMVYQKFGVQLKEEVLYVYPHCNYLNPNRDK
ncbi:UDP-N-acetylenolpyruvoylglucosamine reductase [Actinidia chinensis var. chinensis]|uniref:UDP-N-acetylmuramate dehydrogenase n=1 Tax=Actinidia chinensis var. chinensis TaxID=1590841 RepID=A0A2R6P9Y1_ACTCC|nr:UDP-N-acetylenolpyruvoylglucosamine reductase [Actinidia chinensis var. chinensis]